MASFHGRILIAGGAGFLGSHLCTHFIKDDWRVMCVDNISTGRLRNIAHLENEPAFHAEVTDVSSISTPSGPLDAILHFASPASPVDFERLSKEILAANSLATVRLLEIAREKRCRFLFASSSAVYGMPKVHPQNEDYSGNVNPVGPRSVYDEAKRFGESLSAAYHKSYNVDVRIARIFNTFGERMRPDDGRAVPEMVHRAILGQPITVTGNGTQTRSFMYVDDLVAGIVALLNSSYSMPINLGNPDEISVLRLAEMIKEIAKSDSPITFVPRLVGDPERRCPDIRRAKSILKWQPIHEVGESLAKTVQWYRKDLNLSGLHFQSSGPCGRLTPARRDHGGLQWRVGLSDSRVVFLLRDAKRCQVRADPLGTWLPDVQPGTDHADRWHPPGRYLTRELLSSLRLQRIIARGAHCPRSGHRTRRHLARADDNH